MRRRTYLATTATAATAAVAGCSSEAGSAVNVDDPKELSDADDISFDRDGSVAWIDERFIEYDSPDHPVVNTEVSFQAMVLTNLQSEEERLQEANELQWDNFEFAGDRILGTLFEPVSWVLNPAQELTESFYEKFELMKLVGVSEADQRFFDRHEYVPHVWAVGEDDVFYESGTVVDATGVIRYADQDDDRFAPGTENGMYVELTSAQPVDSYRDLSRDTSVGDTSSFAGLQYVDEPTLTTYLTDVNYEYATDFPKPEGGSLVAQTGEVTEKSFQVRSLVRENNARLRTGDQQIVVGDTHNEEWNGDQSTATPGTDPAEDTDSGSTAVNVVAVIDVSSSMDDADTRSDRARLAVAKESANSLVNFIESDNRLGIVTFSTNARTEAPLRTVGNDRDTFTETISSLRTRDRTSIGGGLEEAIELLRDANGPKSIVLLSDGEENEQPSVSDVLPDLTRLGISVYTIGMGSGADRGLLQTIANETGGGAAFAPNAGEIRSLYQQFSVSAQDRSILASREERLAEGDGTEGTATVDGSCQDVQFSLSHDGGEMTLGVEDPNGEPVEPDDDVSHRVGETNEVWTVDDPETGEWDYKVDAEEVTGTGQATVEVNADSPVDAELFISGDVYEQTGLAKVELKTVEGRRRYTGANATITVRKDRVESSTSGGDRTPTARPFTPTQEEGGGEEEDVRETESPGNGATDETVELQLRDDGGGPDPVADDGLYTGYFRPTETGEYTFLANVSGGSVSGLEREFTDSLTVDTEPDTEEPIRPYLPNSPDSLTNTLRPYVGPAIVLASVAAVFVGVLRTIKED